MTTSRRQAFGLAAAALVLASAPGALAADAALAKAVASEARPAADRARDTFRNPAESLSFWGLKPGQTVVEVSPGGGYWTEILAPYALATKGRYIAGVADLANPNLSEGARKARADFGPASPIRRATAGWSSLALAPCPGLWDRPARRTWF